AASAAGPGRADQTAGQQPVRAYRQLVLSRVPGRSGQGRAQPVAGAVVQLPWQVGGAAPAGRGGDGGNHAGPPGGCLVLGAAWRRGWGGGGRGWTRPRWWRTTAGRGGRGRRVPG